MNANVFAKASPTTLRVDRARSEQGWNVAGSHPRVGSKLRTEIVLGADPLPERPPVSTSVTVVSVMNPSSSFQNVCVWAVRGGVLDGDISDRRTKLT